MKREFKPFVIMGLLIFIIGSNSVLGQDWPQWRGIDRTCRITGFQAPDTWPDQFTQKWKINVGYGDATPALVKGKLYVFTRIGGEEVIWCLDASTGKQIWKASYEAEAVTGPAARHPGPRSTPTVTDGKVILLGASGITSCFDSESGKLLWRNEEFANMVPVYFTGMSPVVYDNKCFAHLGNPEKSAIIAFELASGKIIWKYEGNGPSYASPDMMTIGNGNQVVIQTDKSLIGLDTDDGKLLWEISTLPERRFYNSSSPLIDGQKIFYTGNGLGSLAVKIRKEGNVYSADEVWNNPSIGTNYNTPVLKDGYLFGLSNIGYLYCLNASNGETEWADTTRHSNFGSIIDAGSVILALTSTSNLVVYKPESQKYQEIAIIKVADTPVYAHPVVSGNKMYIKDDESLILYIIE